MQGGEEERSLANQERLRIERDVGTGTQLSDTRNSKPKKQVQEIPTESGNVAVAGGGIQWHINLTTIEEAKEPVIKCVKVQNWILASTWAKLL